MKNSFTTPKKLLIRFLLMTAIVIVLILYSQYSVNRSFKDLKKDEQLVDATREQQRTTLLITQQIAADQLQGIEMTLPLDSLNQKLTYIQEHILTRIDQSDSGYVKVHDSLSKAFASFSVSLGISINNDSINSYVNLVDDQKNYLLALEKLSTIVNENSNAKLSHYKRIQIVVMWATIVILSLSAMFIFLPVIRKIENQNKRLRQIAYNQSHVVRRPLANIKLFLNLMQMAPSEEKGELLGFIQTEAEELDNIICSSVKQTELII